MSSTNRRNRLHSLARRRPSLSPQTPHRQLQQPHRQTQLVLMLRRAGWQQAHREEWERLRGRQAVGASQTTLAVVMEHCSRKAGLPHSNSYRCSTKQHKHPQHRMSLKISSTWW